MLSIDRYLRTFMNSAYLICWKNISVLNITAFTGWKGSWCHILFSSSKIRMRLLPNAWVMDDWVQLPGWVREEEECVSRIQAKEAFFLGDFLLNDLEMLKHPLLNVYVAKFLKKPSMILQKKKLRWMVFQRCFCWNVISLKNHAHTIHVWYIYLHLPYFTIKTTINVGKYTSPMDGKGHGISVVTWWFCRSPDPNLSGWKRVNLQAQAPETGPAEQRSNEQDFTSEKMKVKWSHKRTPFVEKPYEFQNVGNNMNIWHTWTTNLHIFFSGYGLLGWKK